jgi:hypothetical protein
MNFFCSRSCAVKHQNLQKRIKTYGKEAVNQGLKKTCEHCGKEYTEPVTKQKKTRFCSRSCASAGSVTEARREAGFEASKKNLIYGVESISMGLRVREHWRYAKLIQCLESMGIPHVFEYPLDPFVYDLAFLEPKIIVEFDGRNQEWTSQKEIDREKDIHAEKHGFEVVRIVTDDQEPISPSAIKHLLPRLIFSFDYIASNLWV